MATPSHTPVPWKTSVETGDVWTVCEAGGGDTIADLRGCANAEANARFVVHACNSHNDLLAALESMLAWAPHLVLRDKPGKEGRSLAYAGAVENARAAIRRAKGEA